MTTTDSALVSGTTQHACSADLQRQIYEVEAAIAPLQDRLCRLMGQKRKADSIAFIAANRITRDDVEMSDGKDKPWFGDVWTFAKWIKANRPDKLWAEWNGSIYHAADLIAGRMPDMPGCTDDLPNNAVTGSEASP